VDTLSNFDLYILIAVIVFGATGTYLLLPHSHGRAKPKLAHRVGYVLSALAILAFALCWRAANVELVPKVFFYVFAISAVFCAILTITSRDPIHSALWFAGVVLATSGLFLLSGAQFLAAGTVIVYAGAIIVTFLFVIMLAQKEGRAIYDRMARAPFFASLTSFLLLSALIFMLMGMRDQKTTPQTGDNRLFVPSNRVKSAVVRLAEKERLTPKQAIVLNRALPSTSLLPEATGRPAASHVASLGATLYTEHLVTVEIAGALLFAALIGALAIATPRTPIRPKPGAPSTESSIA
jgi:NADH-quinone oxidoreductase subunit J